MKYKKSHMSFSEKTKAFTLVELLVVMTIVAILSTLWSVYFFGYFENSRDTVRTTDLWNIEKALAIYYSTEGKYPDPDEAVDLSYSWSVAWSQGLFGKGVSRNMRIFGSDVPTDPNYGVAYTYSVANRNSEYQIAGVLEWEVEEETGIWELVNMIVPETHAWVQRAVVRWDFNQFMVQVSTGWIDYYIATPSLISADLTSTGVLDTIVGLNLVYEDFFNIPAAYSGSLDTKWGFNFNVSDPIVFEGTLEELKTQEWLTDFAEKLSYIYATTPTENFDTFRQLLDSDNKVTTLKDFLSSNFRVSFSDYFNCRDIYDSGLKTNGNYQIDPDGIGPEPLTDVYCDMETWGGWWTKKEFLDVSFGDFNSGNDIASLVEKEDTISIVNLWVANTPVDSWYAMRQTWGASYYQIGFEDQINQINDLEVGDEVRLSLWVRDDNDTSANSWVWCSTSDCLLTPSAWYAFHNTMYGNDGLNDNNGYVSTIDTFTTADGRVWKHQLLRKKITRPLDDFFWKIGQGFWATKDIYMTWVQTEVFYWWYDN